MISAIYASTVYTTSASRGYSQTIIGASSATLVNGYCTAAFASLEHSHFDCRSTITRTRHAFDASGCVDCSDTRGRRWVR